MWHFTPVVFVLKLTKSRVLRLKSGLIKTDTWAAANHGPTVVVVVVEEVI